MKTILNILAKGLAGLLFVALLAVNVDAGLNDGHSIMNLTAMIDTPTAQAGPCGNRGCEGSEGSCGESYCVVEVGNWCLERSCNGDNTSEEPSQ